MISLPMNRFYFGLSKLSVYLNLWGFRQTLYKTLGRSSLVVPLSIPSCKKSILVIGCGQFAFSTLAPRLLKLGIFSPIAYAYDPNTFSLRKFCVAYSAKPVDLSNLNHFDTSGIDLVYICSDHYSHFAYAKHFLLSGIDVYCEKPLTTSLPQLHDLASVISSSSARFFAGYNRPHSSFVRTLRDTFISSDSKQLFLNFHVSGHFLTSDHWYRSSAQGSRIYGNLGHWIDLFVHTCFWLPELPAVLDISIFYLDTFHSDENILVHISDGKSIFASITFSCLTEPITGVNESLVFSSDKFTARIRNFETMELDLSTSLRVFSHRHKSAGHVEAIRQPFSPHYRSDVEPLISEILLSKIKSVVSSRGSSCSFDLKGELSDLYSLSAPDSSLS